MSSKKIIVMHCNDIHSDFLPKIDPANDKLIGGLAYLSGYIKSIRRSNPDCLFIQAGDMIQGSIIDKEWKGISTIELMNYLAPDIVCLGNHEFDYGLRHLLFLEKLANFPIVSANLYIRNTNRRLMRPFEILKVAGLTILFIGILTEETLDSLKSDVDVSAFITIEDAADEVRRICNVYKTIDIDLTVLLTHIGLEADQKLARLLEPSLGVDLIIGGHTHSIMEQPLKVNGIIIAQAGCGSEHVGRFDLIVDNDTNRVMEWNWQLITITPEIAPLDAELDQYLSQYNQKANNKYNSVLTHFKEKLTHPGRFQETALGNLFADILATWANVDIALVGSGSIRWQSLGPIVSQGDFLACYPFQESIYRHDISGEILVRIFNKFMTSKLIKNGGEYFQVNRRVRALFSDQEGRLLKLELDGEVIQPDRLYCLVTDEYHFMNSLTSFGLLSADGLNGGI